MCSVGNFTLDDFDRISVGKEILLQIFLSNGSGVCTDLEVHFENRKARTRMQCLFFCTAKCSMGIDFTKRNKLQVEIALRASSALAVPGRNVHFGIKYGMVI